jgi:transposase InsO family protein
LAFRFRRSRWQRAYVERVIGTLRRDCLDHMIIFSEASLRLTLLGYLRYYHESRTHLSLAKDTPEPRPVQVAEAGRIVSIPQMGGLHPRYERRAA